MLDSKTPEQLNDTVPQEIQRGSRGETVGTATVSDQIKLMWHLEHFNIEDVNDKKNPRKQCWAPKHHNIPSLKKYARQLAASGDEKNEVAKNWFANKGGKLNADRSDKNKARVATERTATKSSRKATKSGGGK
jgi:hypothetical protein